MFRKERQERQVEASHKGNLGHGLEAHADFEGGVLKFLLQNSCLERNAYHEDFVDDDGEGLVEGPAHLCDVIRELVAG